MSFLRRGYKTKPEHEHTSTLSLLKLVASHHLGIIVFFEVIHCELLYRITKLYRTYPSHHGTKERHRFTRYALILFVVLIIFTELTSAWHPVPLLILTPRNWQSAKVATIHDFKSCVGFRHFSPACTSKTNKLLTYRLSSGIASGLRVQVLRGTQKCSCYNSFLVWTESPKFSQIV
jgi:hypothetical protein